MLRNFYGAFAVAAVGLALAGVYGGGTGLALAAILAVLEVSLSFDNAVVNATVLVRLNPFWQKLFLTLGVVIAVFGMRFVFPLVIVGITAKLDPVQAIRLALADGNPATPGSYGYLLKQAHPAIAAFGGVFLLLIFFEFVFEERETTWLSWLERPLARIGKLDQLGVVLTLALLFVAAYTLAPADRVSTVLGAGVLGIAAFLLVNGLGQLFDSEEPGEDDEERVAAAEAVAAVEQQQRRAGRRVGAAGRAALFLFVYLEMLDASFSFDGVIGAFAITSDPIVIAIGLGIGAMFIRSLTVFLVRNGTLSEYVYLEHGALWAIGALAVILLATIRWGVPEVVTGLIGVAFIGAALASSAVRSRRAAAA